MSDANYMQRMPGGICFAHGPYTEMECPKWPACATDKQNPDFVKAGTDSVRRESTGQAENSEKCHNPYGDFFTDPVVIRHVAVGVTKIIADALNSKFTPTKGTFAVREDGSGYAVVLTGETNPIYLTIAQTWADGYLTSYEAV